MALTTTQDLLDDAEARGGGLCAFNVITLEHAEAVVGGAEQAGCPAVVQVSENAVRFHQGRVRPLAAALRVLAESAAVPLSLHLDHVTSEELLHQAADAGFSSVMFDAAALPYEENEAATRRAAEWAHGHALHLEAELGAIGGKGGAHAPGVRTDPEEAAVFVAETGVDSLAVAVGSTHARTTRDTRLDADLIGRLRAQVPVPLVLHGSSGVPDLDLAEAIRRGITKVNIGTLLNIRYSDAVRGALADAAVVDPRGALSDARAAMADAVAHLCRLLDRPS